MARTRTSISLVAGFLLLGGCEGRVRVVAMDDPGSAATPNVVLITIDTLRADHCSAYGYDRRTTPVLDAIAAEGALFETAYAPTATTLPSHATLFTSLHPAEHGVLKNGLAVPEELTTLAEHFRAAGYETAAFVSSFVVSRRFGLSQGFAHYDDDFTASPGTMRPSRSWEGHLPDDAFDRIARATTERAIRWLDARESTRPFLLWVHLFDPHAPYAPPEPFRSEFVRSDPRSARERYVDLYDGDVRYADSELGRLLDAVDARSNRGDLVTLVTADHGEGLLDHGWLEHGVHLYEEAVRVPLVVRWPGRVPPGARIPGLVGLVDVLPTLLSLAGIGALDAPMRGADLAPVLMAGLAVDPDRRIYLHRRHYEVEELKGIRVAGPKWGIRWQSWKLIEAPGEGTELYDLKADPRERRNVAEDLAGLAASLRGELAAWKAGWPQVDLVSERPSDDVRERLRALGYVE